MLFAPMFDVEVLVDASFTSTFDTGTDLLMAVAYLAVLLMLGLLAFWRAIVGRG